MFLKRDALGDGFPGVCATKNRMPLLRTTAETTDRQTAIKKMCASPIRAPPMFVSVHHMKTDDQNESVCCACAQASPLTTTAVNAQK